MKSTIYLKGLAAMFAGLAITGCKPEIEAPKPTKGEAEFRKYIAVGNSLTSGYMDGGVYREGQLNSYPAIMAEQFKTVGGGEFVQPLFTEAQRNGTGYIKLIGFTSGDLPITTFIDTDLAIRGTNPTLYTKFTGEINNLGVTDIKVADVKTVNYGSVTGNPHFERITSDPNETYLQRIQRSTDHTFFSNWLGNNDVLHYATRGGFGSQLTDVTTFTTNYSEVINALTANGAKGIVVTIPDITGVPFFTVAGPLIKTQMNALSIPGLIALTGSGSNRIIVSTNNIKDAAGGTILFPLTAAAYVQFAGRPGGKFWRDLAKQQHPNDPAAASNALKNYLNNLMIDTTQLFGVMQGNPWPSALLLDDAEQSQIKTHTNMLNTVIRNQATVKNLAIWDSNEFFTNKAIAGFSQNAVPYSAAFISGNLFSMDGVHPTPRGYAIIANEMIKAINAQYNSRIPTVDETRYRALLFPD